MVWEAISKTRKSVSSGIQTPRSRSKKLGCASFFQPTSRGLDILMKHSFSCLIYYRIPSSILISNKTDLNAAKIVNCVYNFLLRYSGTFIKKSILSSVKICCRVCLHFASLVLFRYFIPGQLKDLSPQRLSCRLTFPRPIPLADFRRQDTCTNNTLSEPARRLIRL